MNISIDQDYIAEKRLKASAFSSQAKMVFNQLTAKAKYGNARENTLALAEIDRLEAENTYYQGELIRVEKAIKRKEEHITQLKEKLEVLKANPAPLPPSHLRKLPRAYVAAAAAQIVTVTHDPNCPEPETPAPLLTEAVPEGTELPEGVPAGSVPGEPQPEPLVSGIPVIIGDGQEGEPRQLQQPTAVVIITSGPLEEAQEEAQIHEHTPLQQQLQEQIQRRRKASTLAAPLAAPTASQLAASPSTPSQMALGGDQGQALPLSDPAKTSKLASATPPPPPPLPSKDMLAHVPPQRIDSSTDATGAPVDSRASTRTLVNAPGVAAKQDPIVFYEVLGKPLVAEKSVEADDSFKIPVVRV